MVNNDHTFWVLLGPILDPTGPIIIKVLSTIMINQRRLAKYLQLMQNKYKHHLMSPYIEIIIGFDNLFTPDLKIKLAPQMKIMLFMQSFVCQIWSKYIIIADILFGVWGIYNRAHIYLTVTSNTLQVSFKISY